MKPFTGMAAAGPRYLPKPAGFCWVSVAAPPAPVVLWVSRACPPTRVSGMALTGQLEVAARCLVIIVMYRVHPPIATVPAPCYLVALVLYTSLQLPGALYLSAPHD